MSCTGASLLNLCKGGSTTVNPNVRPPQDDGWLGAMARIGEWVDVLGLAWDVIEFVVSLGSFF